MLSYCIHSCRMTESQTLGCIAYNEDGKVLLFIFISARKSKILCFCKMFVKLKKTVRYKIGSQSFERLARTIIPRGQSATYTSNSVHIWRVV